MENFEVRRASLFASLDTAAQEVGQSLRKNRFINDDERLDIDLADPVDNHHNNKRLSGMRGRRSMFLRPSAPINRCLRSHRMPDYQRNPHKWKKYTLADADDSDLANRVGALLYFSTYGEGANEVEEKEEEEEEEKVEANVAKKIKFNKIKNNLGHELRSNRENPDAQLDNPQLKGSKLVMPEYVIGQKATTTNKKTKSSTNKERASGKLQLTHLQEEEEEDDD